MTKVPFKKSGTTPQQQISLLKTRGITFSDTAYAEHFLSYHNYYNLSGYVYYFEIKDPIRTHRLARNVTFENIVTLVQFDQELRELFLKAVFAIENALRSVIAREIALQYGPFGLENPAIYRDTQNHGFLISKLNQALGEHNKEPFIAHFSKKYIEPIPPVWVMIEVITFGTISRLYSNLTTSLQKQIAHSFAVDHIILVSWLKALTELRNTCAHHGRLWNKVFVNAPKIRSADKTFPLVKDKQNRLGSFIPLIMHLLSRIHECAGWESIVNTLLTSTTLFRPEDLGLQHFNFAKVSNTVKEENQCLYTIYRIT